MSSFDLNFKKNIIFDELNEEKQKTISKKKPKTYKDLKK